MVFEGQISSIYEIFEEGYRIKEVEIVDVLVPELRDDVIDINLVQKQTDAGERSRFRAVVAMGNDDGLIGIGIGKAPRVRNAIEKGIRDAKMKIYPIRRGCGSWECDCSEPHTVPFKISGKSGSVVVTLLPGSKGLGIVAGDTAKRVLTLAGIKDCWTKSTGATQTTVSFTLATFEALKNTMTLMTPKDWAM
jgi:small subunit ribosomal protein S5